MNKNLSIIIVGKSALIFFFLLAGCAEIYTARVNALFNTPEIQTQKNLAGPALNRSRIYVYRKVTDGYEEGWIFIDKKRVPGHLSPLKFAVFDVKPGVHTVSINPVSRMDSRGRVNIVGGGEVTVSCDAGKTYFIRQSQLSSFSLVPDDEGRNDISTLKPSGQ